MPSITATPEPTRGLILIQINWSDLATVTFARVQRVLTDGTTDYVRVHTFTDTSGEYIELSGGLAILYDTEAPLDVPLTYVTDSTQSATTATTAGQEVLPSSSNLFLKSPIHPWADQRLVLQIPQEPGCVPDRAIFFGGVDVEVRSARSNAFVVNNRKNPIVSARVRAGIASSLTLFSRTFADRDAVITLNEPGDPLFLEGPTQYGLPDQYMSVADYSVLRLTPDHRQESRANVLTYVEVDRPAGLMDGVLGTRWADLCDKYATFGDATAAGLTWTGVLLGFGSQNPGPPDVFRLYSDIPLDFATYADIPVGSRTYEGLMEGR